MSTVAPNALYGIYKLIDPYFTTSKIGGVVGDSKHGNGYHLSREDLLRRGLTRDYSIQCPADKRGPANAAAGIDITFGSLAELVTMHKRLRAACTPDSNGDYDPRIECVREVIGTLDGKNVSGYNRVATGSGSRSRLGWVSSGFADSSHLWHEHVSVLRGYVEDANAMRGLAEVMAGVAPGTLGWVGEGAVAPVEPPPFVWDGKSFPGAERFGEGVSGPWVTWLGERLVAHGYTGYKVGPGPEWGAADLAGVKWAQGQQGFTGDDADGIPGETTWAWLAADPVVTPPPVTPPPVVKPPSKPDVSATDEDEEPKPVTATVNIAYGNILRRTDTEPGRKRWPARKANVVKHFKSANPSVILACECDKETADDIAAGLGDRWSYYPSQFATGKKFSPLAVFWDTDVWERREDSFVTEYGDNENRFLQRQPLVHKETGKTVTFYASHLENDGDPSTDGHKARYSETKQWAAWTLDGPGVWGADINSTTRSSASSTTREKQKPRPVLKAAGWKFLTDQSGVANRQYASHHGGKGSVPKGAWIDDMGFKGVTYVDGALIRTDGTDASDHHFLTITIKF